MTEYLEIHPQLRSGFVPSGCGEGFGARSLGCGEGNLTVENVAGFSTLTASSARSPLKILVPRPRGQSVWAYLSSFGGGLVAGDRTRLRISVGENARCFITTQASTKVYRNPRKLPCGHETIAHVASGGLLVFAPDPVQCFAGSSYTQQQSFHLGDGAALVLLDWLSCGRSARGERWAFIRYLTRNEIKLSKGERSFSSTPSELVLLDSTRLDVADGPIDAPMRMGHFNCLAMLVLLGDSLAGPVRHILEHFNNLEVTRGAALLCSASPIHQGAVLRVAGPSVEAVANVLARQLAFLGDELGDNPLNRKY